MKPIIAPSVLSADFSNMSEEIEKLEKSSAEFIHLDVMDGHFVPPITFGPQFIKSIRGKSKKIFDAHLMVSNPEAHIDSFAAVGCDIITIHAEVASHLHKLIAQIKNHGIKAGVALNPSTPVEMIKWVIQDVDMVLIMSVNPGFGGQSFIPTVVDKIREVKKLNPNILIQVDGGINEQTAKIVMEAGANVLVAGSFVFQGNFEEQIQKLIRVGLAL
ncbi:MAG: ribulose-phosphate 3-epimerase [Fusobacteria bacterium]|nr:ribulose-phosphate 3-epimerase [Fusobacteriota bacterium]